MKEKQNNDYYLRKIIKNSGFENPSENFSSIILNEINSSPLSIIVGEQLSVTSKLKKFAITFFLFVLALISLVIFIPYETNIESNSDYSSITSQFIEILNSIFKNDFVTFVPYILISVFLLLLIDRIIEKKIFD